ncbi:MAG TPA: nuclear transport factor 2 family protein [Myxococcota bacterium]|jgi:ketosteroid isomerase-like protein
MNHPNRQLARRIWDAIARGDADTLRSLLAPGLVWRAMARGTPWSGLHQGADAAIEMLARVGEAAERFDAQLVDVLVSDERVGILFHARVGFGGREAELDYLALARVAGGRFTEIVTVPLDPAALERIWQGRPGEWA